MQNSKIKNIITAAAFLALLVVASVLAYFSGSDVVTNRLSAINLDITLTESKWRQSTEPVLPDEVLEKKPQVTNNGEADAFVFLRVRVPYILNGDIDYSGGEVLPDGSTAKKGQARRAENEPMPLFKFVVTENGTDRFDENLTSGQLVHDERWTLLSGYPLDDRENMELVYVYAFTEPDDSGTLTKTKKGDPTTVALFDKIKLVNYGGEFLGDNVGGRLEVNVEALAIQTEALGDGVDASEPLRVWNTLLSQAESEVSGE